jgi:hypothetical protein
LNLLLARYGRLSGLTPLHFPSSQAGVFPMPAFIRPLQLPIPTGMYCLPSTGCPQLVALSCLPSTNRRPPHSGGHQRPCFRRGHDVCDGTRLPAPAQGQRVHVRY